MPRLICVAGDVGGARALAPVAWRASTSGLSCSVINHGVIASDYQDRDVPWQWVPVPQEQAMIEPLFDDLQPNALLFASSVQDEVALELALAAQQRDIPVAHILDNWSNYAARLRTNDGRVVVPELYFVMDELARTRAIAEGVAEDTLKVTGTPALSDVREQAATPGGNVLFISEPVTSDQGADPEKESYRGYTEIQVLKELMSALQRTQPQVTLSIFPHPRDDVDALREVVNANHSSTSSSTARPRHRVVAEPEKAELLGQASAVIGMSSILLYQAWLSGLPALSLQPNARHEHLRYLDGRQGLSTVYDIAELDRALTDLFGEPSPAHLCAAEKERQQHRNAAASVVAALRTLIP